MEIRPIETAPPSGELSRYTDDHDTPSKAGRGTSSTAKLGVTLASPFSPSPTSTYAPSPAAPPERQRRPPRLLGIAAPMDSRCETPDNSASSTMMKSRGLRTEPCASLLPVRTPHCNLLLLALCPSRSSTLYHSHREGSICKLGRFRHDTRTPFRCSW